MHLLIQRCMFRDPQPPRDAIDGFDKVFSCDYMGSAEFEYGSLPASLKFVTSNLSLYSIHAPKEEYRASTGERVFLYCQEAALDNVEAALKAMAADVYNRQAPITFKERPGFKESLAGTNADRPRQRVVLWWDIENHWFACLGKPTATTLELAMTRLQAKYRAAGKIK